MADAFDDDSDAAAAADDDDDYDWKRSSQISLFTPNAVPTSEEHASYDDNGNNSNSRLMKQPSILC